jgi:hypothetical protein
VYIY